MVRKKRSRRGKRSKKFSLKLSRKIRRNGRGRKIRRHGRKVRRNGRRRHRNPSAIASPLAAVKQAFNVDTLKKAGVMAVGAVGMPLLKAQITNLSFMPGFLKTGIGSNILGLALSGLVGAGVGRMNKDLGRQVFFGGVLGEAISLAGSTIVPMISSKMSGFGDYLSVNDAAGARSLGDYLTVSDAAGARSLGDMTVSSELSE